MTDQTAIKRMVEMQPGDVFQIYAGTTSLEQELHFKPQISIQEGNAKLYDWYVAYSKLFEKERFFRQSAKYELIYKLK